MLSSQSLFFQRALCAFLSLAILAESAPFAFADMDEYGRVQTTELPRHRRYLPLYSPPAWAVNEEVVQPAEVPSSENVASETPAPQAPSPLSESDVRQIAREAAELWRNSGDASRRIALLPSVILGLGQDDARPQSSARTFRDQADFHEIIAHVSLFGAGTSFWYGMGAESGVGMVAGALSFASLLINWRAAKSARFNASLFPANIGQTELLRHYFDELRREGIVIPEGTLQEQMLWWETVNRVGAFEAGLMVTPASVAAQIQAVEMALIAILPKVSEEVQELLRELIDDLPSRRSFRRRLQPKRWMMSSMMKLYEVRARLAQIASTLDDRTLKAIDASITQHLIEETRSQALSAAPDSFRAFRSLDVETRDLLATKDALLLHTPTVLDYFQRSPEPLPIQISNAQILAASGPGRLATYQSSVRLILDHDSGQVVEFTTRWNAPSNDLQTALQTGRWAPSIASMLESRLAAAPWVELESQAQGCEATMMPVDHEDALEELEEALSAPTSRRGSR